MNTLFIDSSDDGYTLNGAQEITSIKMGSTPSMVGYSQKLAIAFQSNSNHDLFVCLLTPNPGAATPYPGGCTDYPSVQINGTPYLATDGSNLWVSYINSNSEIGIVNVFGAGPTLLGAYAGSAPAIAYYNYDLVLAFQADDSSHALFIKTSTNGGESFGTATRYATTINSAPALTVTDPGGLDSTLLIGFWGNAPNTNLWFEDYYGYTLEPAQESSAEVGSSPAEVTWTPRTGSYANKEITSVAFRSQNSSDHLFLGANIDTY